MDLGIHDKVAIVTGASSEGIGRAIAMELAKEGARVALVSRRENLLKSLAKQIREATGQHPLVIASDVTAKSASTQIHKAVNRGLGAVDILINCAGASRPLPVTAPDEDWEKSILLNFSAVRRLTHQILPDMQARGWGRIINITGTSEPPMLNAAHSAKAAVHAWAKGLSLEIGKQGITINSVAPGKILSEQIRERIHPTAANRKAFAKSHIPVGFFGEPQDMADLVTFLASRRARYITGEVIHVDGGLRRFAF